MSFSLRNVGENPFGFWLLCTIIFRFMYGAVEIFDSAKEVTEIERKRYREIILHDTAQHARSTV